MRLRHPFLLTALALAASQSHSQTAAAGGTADAPTNVASSEVQTVIVKGRRVEERIIDVPLTIKALSGAALQERGISSLAELSTFTPGLSYSPDYGRVAERPVIRGISALRPEAPQPVSVFVDGIFVRDGALGLALDDAQRIEVIKGPQSALYGRSTYAGAINYITPKPGNKLEGKISMTVAEAGEIAAFAAVSMPVVKDKVAVRIKAKTHEYGGQYTNIQTGNKIGSEKTDAMGMLWSFTPSTSFDAKVSLDQSTERDGFFPATVRTVPIQSGGVVTDQNGSTNVANGSYCNGRLIDIVGSATAKANGWTCGPSTFTGTLVNRNEADFANYTDPATGVAYGNIAGMDRTITRSGLTLNYYFGDGYTLTSQTGYTRQRTNLGADQSYNGSRFSIFGTSWLTYNRDHLEYLSQEIRLSSPEHRAFSWLVGAFYYDEDASGLGSDVIQRAGASAPVTHAPLRASAGSSVTNVAPFGRIQYAFNKDLRVSLEGRYNRETVEVAGTPQRVATVNSGTCVAGQVCVVNGQRTFSDFSPRLTLDYKPSRDALVYGQLATGSKSGGFNTAAGIPAESFAYNGEQVKSVEVGYKSVLASGKVSFNAALFRNDIEGLQLSNLIVITNPYSPDPSNPATTTTTIVNNVGKARTQGLEFDVSMRATDWLSLAANYAYTDAKALEGTETTNGTVFGGNTSVAGFVLPRSPKHSAAVSAAVDAPIGAGDLRGFGRVDVVYQSRRYAAIQNLIWADPFTHVNLSTGVRGKDWRLTLWVKNATNDDTSLNGFRYVDPGNFRRSAVDFLPRLRQFGLTANFDF